MSDWTRIAPTRVDLVSGAMEGATRHYQKRYADLEGVFEDVAAFEARRAAAADEVAYDVYEYRRSDDAGDLVFGTSRVYPGLVGREFNMTRGHAHVRGDRAELYYCLSGHGVLLLQEPESAAQVVELYPGTAAYVPPFARHRSINVGHVPLVTLFCYPSDSGQDYDVVSGAHGMRLLVVRDPSGGWTVEENPAYAPPTESASPWPGR